MKSLRAVVYVYASIVMLASWSASAAAVALPDDGFMSGPRAILNGINNLQGSAQAEAAAIDVAGNVRLIASRSNVERIQTQGDIFLNSQTCALMANEIKNKGNLNALGVSMEHYSRLCITKEGNFFVTDTPSLLARSSRGMPGGSQDGEGSANWMEWLAKGGVHNGDANAQSAFMVSVHGAGEEHSSGAIFDAASGALDGILAEAQKSGGERGFVMEGPEFETPANAKLAQLANNPNASALGFEGFVSSKAPQVSFYNGGNGAQSSSGQLPATASNPMVRHLMSNGSSVPKAPSDSATHSRTPASDTKLPAPTTNLPDVSAQVNDPKKPEVSTDNSAPRTNAPVQSMGGDSLLDTLDNLQQTITSTDDSGSGNFRSLAEKAKRGIEEIQQSADTLKSPEGRTLLSNDNTISSQEAHDQPSGAGVFSSLKESSKQFNLSASARMVKSYFSGCIEGAAKKERVDKLDDYIQGHMAQCGKFFTSTESARKQSSCSISGVNTRDMTAEAQATCALVDMAARSFACASSGDERSIEEYYFAAVVKWVAVAASRGSVKFMGGHEDLQQMYGRACSSDVVECPLAMTKVLDPETGGAKPVLSPEQEELVQHLKHGLLALESSKAMLQRTIKSSLSVADGMKCDLRELLSLAAVDVERKVQGVRATVFTASKTNTLVEERAVAEANKAGAQAKDLTKTVIHECGTQNCLRNDMKSKN
ncbi:MAG TPA: hypothetical protein VM901_05475 [Bdellovibrionota bacterium]|nr:hypothetical protein [Bdellovibrionota bacterium]